MNRSVRRYVLEPFTVAHAQELAHHIAVVDAGQFSVWVELRDEEGAGRYVAAFDISYGRVTRDEVPK